MGKKVTDYLLYRWRYIVGYGLIGLTIISLLLIAGLYIPGGLSTAEIQSVVTSSQLSVPSLESFDPRSVINLPYNVLQRVSIELFGLSNFSIKLPSLFLAALSALGMILLLQMWFRRNVAVLTTVLVITTGQFLFVAQSGTPSIVYIFWSVWLLVAAMMISRRAPYLGFWKIILFSFAALSLYTPLSAYILIALTSAIILHPHLRYLVRKMLKARSKVAIACVCALLLLAPLIYAIVRDQSIGLELLGIPATMPDLRENLFLLLKQYFNFMAPGSGVLMTPVYGIGSLVLIVLGIIRLSSTNYTARSYIITAWVILLIPVLLINPNFNSITFVPAMLLMAMGINTLLSSWYQLFPKNPYARIAGLIPLTILIGGLFLTGVNRYMYGYTYDPNTAGSFSHDLTLVNKQLREQPDTPKTLVVTKDEQSFYEIVAKQHANTTVATTAIPNEGMTIVSRQAYLTGTFDAPLRVITGSSSANADRFYIYKTDSK